MHKEESLDRFRRQERLSSGGQLSIKGGQEGSSGELRGRGQHASDSGYGTDSPGYSGHFPGHYRDPVRSLAAEEDIVLTSDSESEDLHDALSVSSACDDDDVFLAADMMTVYFESPSARITPNKEHNTDQRTHEMDDLDELDGDSPPKDTSDPIQISHSGAELRGAVGGTRPRALPLTISNSISTSTPISNTISSAMDIPSSPRNRSPSLTSVNFTPPRFYSGNTSFPFPPSPTPFGSPSESVFTFGRRAPPPSNLQRSLHIGECKIN